MGVTRRWVILCLTLGLFPLQSHGAFCPSTPKCLLTRRGSTKNRERGKFKYGVVLIGLALLAFWVVWLSLNSGKSVINYYLADSLPLQTKCLQKKNHVVSY